MLHNELLIDKLGDKNVVVDQELAKRGDEPLMEDVENHPKANDIYDNLIPTAQVQMKIMHTSPR